MQILKISKYIVIYIFYFIFHIFHLHTYASQTENYEALSINNTIHGYLSSVLSVNIIDPKKPNIKIEYKKYLKNQKNPIKSSIEFKNNDKFDFVKTFESTYVSDSKKTSSKIIIEATIANNEACLYSVTSYGKNKITCAVINQNQSSQQKEKQFKVSSEGSQLKDKSKAYIGTIINDLLSSLDKILIEKKIDETKTLIVSIQTFTVKFKQFLIVMLIFYSFWSGANILSKAQRDSSKANSEESSGALIARFLIKMILVVYFATGFNIDEKDYKGNGVQNLILPLVKGITFFTSKTILDNTIYQSNIKSNLADKPIYSSENIAYALTDPIDAVLISILNSNSKLDKILETKESKENTKKDAKNTKKDPENTKKDAMKVAGVFLSLIILIIKIIILFLLINIIIGCVAIYSINILMIYFLSYIAVIFVPCALFENTSNYYENWFKFFISCVLQIIMLSTILSFILFLITINLNNDNITDVFIALIYTLLAFEFYKKIIEFITKLTEGLTAEIKINFFVPSINRKKDEKNNKTNEDKGSAEEGDKGLASSGGDKGLASSGGDKGLASSGGDKGLASSGGDKGLASLRDKIK